MKIFDTHFFSGTFLTGLGILSFVVGALSLFPSAQNVIMSVVLVLLGIALVVYGRKRAKVAPPPASKIAAGSDGDASAAARARVA